MLNLKRKNDNLQAAQPPKKSKTSIKMLDAPPVNSIIDLINLSNTNKLYKNLDTFMLWRISPYLNELNNLIGMDELKKSIFLQIIYYLQSMHMNNKNEEYLHTVIMGIPGCGKCMKKDTPVIMYNGDIKMIQDVKVGDVLMGDDSTPRNVLSLAVGREKMFKIKQENGNDYIVNQSHILSLKRLDNVIDIPLYDYIKLDDEYKKSLKGFKVGVDFKKVNVPFDSYIVGIWLGSNTNHITIEDEKILSYIFDKDGTSDLLINVLSNLDMLENKHIPNIYKINDKETRLKLLAGIIDSCGYINNEYICIDKLDKLKDDIIFLVRSLGLYCLVDKDTIKIKEENNGFIPLLIKKNYQNNIEKYNLDTDITVEELDIDDYYGFVLDGNSRYLLGDFTVTHNTTVARIIGKIYQAMGIISKNGIFKIAYRDDFVAEYLGQTAIKTKKLLNSCLGGILFIDEVYSLGNKEGRDSFSKEAIDTITGFLSDHKNDFCCIIAGYEKEINECFFKVNRGLVRRFPWIHKIEPYNAENLSNIALKMIKNMKWDIAIEEKIFINFFEEHKDNFKHAGGDIETFLTKSKMLHAKRVFSLGKEHKFILTLEDLKNAINIIKQTNKKEDEDKPPLGMYI